MSESGDIEGWNGDRRPDGVRVRPIGRVYVAMHPIKPSIVTCPCCSKPFATSRAAKLVANAMWPIGWQGKEIRPPRTTGY
jgi:hypothetical protein